MKPALPLRIASILALIAAVGHTALFLTYKPTHGPDEIVVVTAMQTHVFSFGGFLHSYWQLYFGYQLFVTISCLVESAILWQLATLSVSAPSSIRLMIIVLFLGEVATSILMLKFFFLIPIVVHSATALCLALALTALAQKPQSSFQNSQQNKNLSF
jgi:hypothetical protein